MVEVKRISQIPKRLYAASEGSERLIGGLLYMEIKIDDLRQ